MCCWKYVSREGLLNQKFEGTSLAKFYWIVTWSLLLEEFAAEVMLTPIRPPPMFAGNKSHTWRNCHNKAGVNSFVTTYFFSKTAWKWRKEVKTVQNWVTSFKNEANVFFQWKRLIRKLIRFFVCWSLKEIQIISEGAVVYWGQSVWMRSMEALTSKERS